MPYGFIQLIVLEALGDLTLAVAPKNTLALFSESVNLPESKLSHHIVKKLIGADALGVSFGQTRGGRRRRAQAVITEEELVRAGRL